jgi:hypothetical protein
MLAFRSPRQKGKILPFEGQTRFFSQKEKQKEEGRNEEKRL